MRQNVFAGAGNDRHKTFNSLLHVVTVLRVTKCRQLYSVVESLSITNGHSPSCSGC